MSGRVNLAALEKSSTQQIHHCVRMYSEIRLIFDHYPNRWASQFAAVELHAIWERFAEKRLIAALNHNAAHFLEQNAAKGVKRVPLGLASYIVRGGRRFFDFKNSSDLISIGDRLLSPLGNPFRELTEKQKLYINCLATIRNRIVHRGDAADHSYRKFLRGAPYRMKFVPDPDEFLNATDKRSDSPARGEPRVISFALIMIEAIELTAQPDPF
jgi:hypothetical protein